MAHTFRVGKVVLWTLGSLVGLVLVVIGLVAVVLSPRRLTPLVNRYATQYLDATLRFDTVRLSLWEEFPTVSLKLVRGQIISDAVRGDSLRPAAADTLVRFNELVVSAGAMELLGGEIDIQRIGLSGASVYAYVSPGGKANWEIYRGDSTAQVDTTASLPLDLHIRRIALRDGVSLTYDSRPDSLRVEAALDRLFVRGNLTPELAELEFRRFSCSGIRGSLELGGGALTGSLRLDTLGIRNLRERQNGYDLHTAGDVSLLMQGRQWFDRLPVSLRGGVALGDSAAAARVELNDLRIGVGELDVALDGHVALIEGAAGDAGGTGVVESDLRARVEQLAVAGLLKLAPPELAGQLKKLETNLSLGLDVHVQGRYAVAGGGKRGELPVIDLDCSIPGGYLGYRGMESRIENLALDLRVHFDPGRPALSSVELRRIAVEGRAITLSGRAAVRDPLGEMQVTAAITGRVDLRELLRLMPQEYGIRARGSVGLDIDGKFRASDLTPERISRNDLRLKLTADNLLVRVPRDTLLLMARGTAVEFESYASTLGRIAGARMLRFSVASDTIRLLVGRGTRLGVGQLALSARSSGEIVGGQTGRVPPMGGRITARTLRMHDIDSARLRARQLQASFRLFPSPEDPALPALSFQVRAPMLSYQAQVGSFGVAGAEFDIRAIKRRASDTLRRARTDRTGNQADRAGRAGGTGRTGRPQDELAYADLDLRADQSIQSLLREWNIQGSLRARGGRVATPYFPLRTSLRRADLSFANDSIVLRNTQLRAGQSHLQLTGRIDGIRRVLSGRGRLGIQGELVCDTLNANELLTAIHAGSNFLTASEDYKRSLLEAQDQEQTERLIAAQVSDTLPAQVPLLIIPRNITADLRLQVSHGAYADMTLQRVTGELSIRDRILQLKELSAETDLGQMDLTAIYSTRSKADLTAGFDLELKEIQVERLIALIPQVDTLLPMLRSFQGLLSCQIAATTRLDTAMNIVLPSLSGACRIRGEDLVLLDGETFTQIAKVLKFKNRQENHIDALSVEMIVRDNHIEIFPFLLEMDRYQTAVSGVQGLDMSFDYHISVIHSPLPFRLGVNIRGQDLDHMRIRLGKARYKDASLPSYVALIDTTRLSLRTEIGNIVQRGMDVARMQQAMQAVAMVDTQPLFDSTQLEALTRADSLELAREGLIQMDTSFLSERRHQRTTRVVSPRVLSGAVQTVLDRRADSTGIWSDAGWWNSANVLTALIRYAAAQEQGNRHRAAIEQTVADVFVRAQEQAVDFLNDYYDDQGWWALAWIDAYSLTGEEAYLSMAERIFADMTTGWRTDRCGGGSYWRKSGRYKNAISNNLFNLTAARLYRASGRAEYLDWAERGTAWLLGSGMIRPGTGLVDDGLRDDCTPTDGQYHSYNQGVALAALTEMYLLTGREEYVDLAHSIADATIAQLVDSAGILRERYEPRLGADGVQFKGIFVRHLGFLYGVAPKARYREFLLRNAASILRNDYDPQSRCFGGLWTGPFDQPNTGAHSSALECLIEAEIAE